MATWGRRWKSRTSVWTKYQGDLLFHQYVCLHLYLFVSLYVRLSIRFFIQLSINLYTLFGHFFQIRYPACAQITGNAIIFFLHSMLYCVLLIYDAGCDNRNQWPRRGHYRAPGRHYPNIKKFQIFQNFKILTKFQKKFLKFPPPPKNARKCIFGHKKFKFLSTYTYTYTK